MTIPQPEFKNITATPVGNLFAAAIRSIDAGRIDPSHEDHSVTILEVNSVVTRPEATMYIGVIDRGKWVLSTCFIWPIPLYDRRPGAILEFTAKERRGKWVLDPCDGRNLAIWPTRSVDGSYLKTPKNPTIVPVPGLPDLPLRQ